MKFLRAAVPFLFVTLLSGAAFADETIKVSLTDMGGMMDLSKSMGMGMGMKADMSKAMMRIEVDKNKAAAGKVTFEVTNNSKETVHEMLVAAVASADTMLPYIDNENRVNEEEGSTELGEVEELEPGKSGALTLDLKPGVYALYCNVPGHYMAGMWTTITVE